MPRDRKGVLLSLPRKLRDLGVRLCRPLKVGVGMSLSDDAAVSLATGASMPWDEQIDPESSELSTMRMVVPNTAVDDGVVMAGATALTAFPRSGIAGRLVLIHGRIVYSWFDRPM